MIFQSIEYLLFLVCVLALYYWLPRRGQNVVIIAATTCSTAGFISGI